MQTSPWKAVLVLFQRCTILGTAQGSVKDEAVREVGLPPFGVCVCGGGAFVCRRRDGSTKEHGGE